MDAGEIDEAVSELARQPFDAAECPFAFLTVFGNKETTIKRLRKGESIASDVPGGVLQRNDIQIAVCKSGMVGETRKALRESLPLAGIFTIKEIKDIPSTCVPPEGSISSISSC